jgi:hypothetical protein
VSGESLAWWAIIVALYIGAFAILQLQKHWHRAAEFVFSVATVFTLGWLVVKVWNNPDGFRGGIAFAVGVFAIAGNIWFVRKIEADIQEDKSHLHVAYNKGRYDHRQMDGDKLIGKVIRIQLANRGTRDIENIQVRAERFRHINADIGNVPLQIEHDRTHSKNDGFVLAPKAKERVDIAERGRDSQLIRLCAALPEQYVTQEKEFEIMVAVTAKGLERQRKRLRIKADDNEILDCDSLKI